MTNCPFLTSFTISFGIRRLWTIAVWSKHNTPVKCTGDRIKLATIHLVAFKVVKIVLENRNYQQFIPMLFTPRFQRHWCVFVGETYTDEKRIQFCPISTHCLCKNAKYILKYNHLPNLCNAHFYRNKTAFGRASYTAWLAKSIGSITFIFSMHATSILMPLLGR